MAPAPSLPPPPPNSPWDSLKTVNLTNTISVKKALTNWFLAVNRPRQKDLGSIVVTSCFLISRNSLQTKWRKIIDKLLNKKMQHFHCSKMICKIVTIKYKPFSMKTWHRKHKKMYTYEYEIHNKKWKILRKISYIQRNLDDKRSSRH